MSRRQRLASLAVLSSLACPSGDDGGNASTSSDTSAAMTTTGASTAPGSASGPTSAADDAAGSTTAAAGSSSSAGPAESTGASPAECDDAALAWHTANKTNYESYPDPGSDECVIYHGCDYVGMFEACANTMPEDWVMAHDIAAMFPLGEFALHRICIRSGDTTMIVTVLDTCADADCDGCCTQNRGDADALIDLETYTNMRFGIEDGPIEWADLGPGDPSFDGCN